MLLLAVQQEGDRALLLAIQKPNVTDAGEGYATVEFKSGPTVFPGDYEVACFEQNTALPTNSCDIVAGLEPAGTTNGTLPKGFTTVVANVTDIATAGVFDCFVSASGPAGKFDKCLYAGEATIEQDPNRLLASVIKPNVTEAGEGFATVEFSSVSAISFDYQVACFEQDVTLPTNSCDVVADLEPVGTYNGTTPKRGSTVANVTEMTATGEVDCFVFTEGPLGKLDKCKFAGAADISVKV
jgi:hypothetical protein